MPGLENGSRVAAGRMMRLHRPVSVVMPRVGLSPGRGVSDIPETDPQRSATVAIASCNPQHTTLCPFEHQCKLAPGYLCS